MQPFHRRVVKELVTNHKSQAATFSCNNQEFRFFARQAQRLLNKNMSPRLQGSSCQCKVAFSRSADCDSIDLIVAPKVFGLSEARDSRVALSDPRKSIRIRVANRNDLSAWRGAWGTGGTR